MTATVEIDKAGRIVVPKKMRDALHLTPGTKLHIDQQGEHLTLSAEVRPVRKLKLPLIPSRKPGSINPTEEQLVDAFFGPID